jgi:hypothetical protein
MEQFDDQAEPIPLSRPSSPPPAASATPSTIRKKWSSAPPPMPRRNRFGVTLFAAVWIAIGVASAAYVVQHAHENVATTEAR